MTWEDELFKRHKGKSILLDSNLLFVLLTGIFDRRLLGSYKAKGYSFQDFNLILRLLAAFKVLIVTPHVLTEVSNLANDFPEKMKLQWFERFALLLHSLNDSPEMTEHYTPVREIAITLEFVKFGITDAVLSLLASKALIVTADRRLSGALQSQKKDVLNFQDLRAIQHLLKSKS